MTRQRSKLPTREVRDHVFDAVWHQQTNDIAFSDSFFRQQGSSSIDRVCELRIGEVATVRLGKEKNLVGCFNNARAKQSWNVLEVVMSVHGLKRR